MRIVHISDIHLSADNFHDFENSYRKALLDILEIAQREKEIDIIAITGDLVDQGGHSLISMNRFGTDDPYVIFEMEFINHIKDKLNLENQNFMIIPGNHDIDENEILWVDEKKLQKEEMEGSLDNIIDDNEFKFNPFNKRIQKFKEFEEKFHSGYPDIYRFTKNQSSYIYEYGEGIKVGFAMINDSWRCSTCELTKYNTVAKKKNLYFGVKKQLDRTLNHLSETTLNIIMTHHPIETFAEGTDFENYITNKEFHIHLFGDKHNHKIVNHISGIGGCFGIMARAALNNPNETQSRFQPGFQIIDLCFQTNAVECISYYKYIAQRFEFVEDTDIVKGGKDTTPRPLRIKPREENIVEKQDKVVDLTSLDILKFLNNG
jgi:predicted MPP superfamily phosphohydrolase